MQLASWLAGRLDYKILCVQRVRKKGNVKSQIGMNFYQLWRHTLTLHGVKSAQIRSYFQSVFSCIRTEYMKIWTRNNSVFGHISRSVSQFQQLQSMRTIKKQFYMNVDECKHNLKDKKSDHVIHLASWLMDGP